MKLMTHYHLNGFPNYGITGKMMILIVSVYKLISHMDMNIWVIVYAWLLPP
jgi:hypothetical protein